MSQSLNLFLKFRESVAHHPEHDAVIDKATGEQYSYLRLLQLMEGAAEKLRKAGVSPGNCIGLHYPSGFGYIVWAYAIWARGAVVVPIAVELVPDEKAAVTAARRFSRR